MNDLISRKEAIEWCLNGLNNLPSVEPTRGKWIEYIFAEWRWIPCSERLPERNGVYIVTRTISDGFEYYNITDACYFDGSDIWYDDTRVNHGRKYLTDVIAWMELPEPYKGGESDDN